MGCNHLHPVWGISHIYSRTKNTYLNGGRSVFAGLWNVDDKVHLTIPDLGPMTSRFFVNPSLGFIKFAGLSVKLPL